MINFRLEVFYTTAKELSFTKAAELLSISQPAVTKHIKALEEHYQTSLFHRSGNNIELTEAGKILFLYANQIVNTYELLNTDLQHLSKKKQPLKIGTTSGYNSLFLAELIGYSKFLPFDLIEIHKNLHEFKNLPDEQLPDLILCDFYNPESGLNCELLLSSKILLVSAAHNKISDIAEPEYINYSGNIPNTDKWLVRHTLSGIQSALQVLKRGHFATHLPEILIKNELATQQLNVLDTSTSKYEIFIITVSIANDALNQFKEIIRKNIMN